MSLGQRDQRGRIYTYSSTNDNGVVTSTYTFSVERWCRLGSLTAREATLLAQAEHNVTGVIVFADEVTVGNNDLIEVDDVHYLVRGVTRDRTLREIRVMVEAVDDENLSVVES